MVMSHDDSLAGEIIDVRVELEELLVAKKKKRDNMLLLVDHRVTSNTNTLTIIIFIKWQCSYSTLQI